MAPGVKTSCTSCRLQHIKCNSVHPTCGPCTQNGRACHWAGAFFKHDSNPSIQAGAGRCRRGFADAQKWVEIPRELHFIDETRELQLTYTEAWIGSSLECSEKDGMLSSLTHLQMTHNGDEPDMAKLIGNSSPQNRCTADSSGSTHSPQVSTSSGIGNRQTALQISILLPLRQQKGHHCGLQDNQEVRLLRYFIEKLSSWFDLCDLGRHFATVAPRRALAHPTLLNAICATSARHMSRTTDFDPRIADYFLQACLSTLIPALHDPELLKDENFFSVVVILRLFEELDGSQNLNHMPGIQALLDAQDYSEVRSGLGRAAFQIALRQEIAMAFTHQRPVLAKFMQGHSNLSLSPACETIWADRSSIYLAVVLEFCYGSNGRSAEKWQELVDHHQKWVELRPYEFEPIYVDDSGVAEFPTICYLDDIHVSTANHYTLARLLLTAHKPHASTIVKEGGGEEIEIGYYIRQLCGTAFSNMQVAVAMLSASIAITVFGGRFSDYKTQVSLLDVLVRTEQQHGWSTAVARTRLIKIWGWKKEGLSVENL